MFNFKKVCLVLLPLLFVSQIGCTQQIPSDRPSILNPEFDKKLSQTISFTIPLMGVQELHKIQDEVYIFDTREQKEFDLSDIKGAQFLGFEDFDIQKLGDISKDSKIVLYCSIGYRSEKIGEQLVKLGYSNVYNLYGSIFEWVNQGFPVVDKAGETTRKLHTYNKAWGKWVEDNKTEKIW